MRRTTIAAAATLVCLAVPAAASAACAQKTVKFTGALAVDGGFGEPPGAAVEGNRVKVGGRYVATGDATLRYRKVAYAIEKGTDFTPTCFRPRGSGFESGKGSLPLVALGEGTVEVTGAKKGARRAGVSMRYGLFHADRVRGSKFRVSYRWVDVAIGRGRATLDALRGAPVGFSPGSVAALEGTCQAGETMIVDWKGVRSG